MYKGTSPYNKGKGQGKRMTIPFVKGGGKSFGKGFIKGGKGKGPTFHFGGKPSGKGKAFMSKGRGKKSNDFSRSFVTCNICGRLGHTSENCWKRAITSMVVGDEWGYEEYDDGDDFCGPPSAASSSFWQSPASDWDQEYYEP